MTLIDRLKDGLGSCADDLNIFGKITVLPIFIILELLCILMESIDNFFYWLFCKSKEK